MDIEEYLPEISAAAEPILDLVWVEHRKHDQLVNQRAAAQRQANDQYRRADFLLLNPDLDDEGLGVQGHWDAYFGPDRDQFNLGQEADLQAEKVKLLAFSRAALSATMFQFAKQGLSVLHGQKANVPDGRLIHTVNLKEVIWEGRNHALHWEEENPRQHVVACMSGLAQHKPEMADFRNRNCSFEILQALDWQGWDRFSIDLQSLG